MTTFNQLSIVEAADLIRRKIISPVELVRAHIDHIERMNPLLNCYLTVTAEQALAQAKQHEQAVLKGHYRGRLHGIPIALKDLIDTAGVRTTAGSSFFREHIPTTDAVVVEKLSAAGAINLGKLNLHEIALGTIGDNAHFGPCRNPHDPERICGGSSSGSASALAADLCMGALGTDTGGSIRIPAAHCGIVGLKPTRGRVSTRGVFPLSWSLDHVGPMARTVRDTALLLEAIAAYDPADPFAVDHPTEQYSDKLGLSIAGMRIAVETGTWVHDPIVSEAVQAAYQTAIGQMRALGASIVELDLSDWQQIRPLNGAMTAGDAAAWHATRLADQPDGFGADVLTRLRNEPPPTGPAYAAIRYQQARWTHQVEQTLATVDALMLPTLPFAAPRRDDAEAIQLGRANHGRFVAAFNFTGLPAISVPMPTSGLPLGLQIVGQRWAEADILRIAYAYEQATR